VPPAAPLLSLFLLPLLLEVHLLHLLVLLHLLLLLLALHLLLHLLREEGLTYRRGCTCTCPY
jgi:hypothetical protein